MIRRAGAALPALGLAVLLALYASARYHVGLLDEDFVRRHPASRWFPLASLLEGHRRFFRDLDPGGAAQAYRRALSGQATLMPAWFGLVRAEAHRGRTEEARRMLRFLSSALASVSTWKWEELLLAYELAEEGAFQAAFNFILERLPSRVPDACYTAQAFWGGWHVLADYTDAANRPVLLAELIRSRQLDAALDVWDRAARDGREPDERLTFRLVDALLRDGRLGEAKNLWRRHVGRDHPLVHNGGFEQAPAGAAFGWRIAPSGSVRVERTFTEALEGRYSLHVRFSGTANVNFHHVRQTVPVEPGGAYRLRFARKSRNLSTDKGVYLEVTGFGCSGLRAASEPVLGTRPWEWETLSFRVPENCQAVEIRLRRQESLKFDSKIVGDYWLDAVSVERS